MGTASAVASIGGGISAGEYAGLHFGYSETGNSLYRHSAIVFERDDSAFGDARGNIHILNSPSGSASADLGDARLTILPAGNVGIGTTSPRSIIEAKGNISIFDPSNTLSNGDTLNGLHFYTDEYSYNPPGGRVNTPISKILPVVDSSGTDSFGLSFYTAASDVESSEKLRISSSGNVGIGTTTPKSALAEPEGLFNI